MVVSLNVSAYDKFNAIGYKSDRADWSYSVYCRLSDSIMR